jgi:hypothetical protein
MAQTVTAISWGKQVKKTLTEREKTEEKFLQKNW